MKKKWIFILITCTAFLVMISGILYQAGAFRTILKYFQDYLNYVDGDMEHKATLFESIIGGLCSGTVTFGALFITISHENRKDRMFWKRELEKEKEDRLLSVRPFLNIEVKSVSVSRGGKSENEKNYVTIGQGKQFQYAHIVLTNNGYGKCKKIMLDGHKCSVSQLDVDEKKELDIYFNGLEDDKTDTEFSMYFGYQDIFGNSYLQKFCGYLRSSSKELNIDIEEPLLERRQNI